MAKEKICYYCGKKASSREHVPPKCIFLDSVDGKKNKNNLITVPSCYEHNTAKQKDDEYFRFVLIMSIKSSGIKGKIDIQPFFRAMEKSKYVFSLFIRNPKEVYVIEEGSKLLVPTIAYEPDLVRLHKIIEQVSRAIYYYNYKKIFIGKINITNDGTMSLQDEAANKVLESLSIVFDKEPDVFPYQGENQDIFKYKLINIGNKYYLKMVYYGSNSIIVRMIEEKNLTTASTL